MAKNTLDLTDKNAAELIELLAQKREELRAARFGAATRSSKGDPRTVRADIARILTELGAKSAA